MIAVVVTFRYGEDFNAAKVRQIAEQSKAKFEGMPGLRSKLFSVSAELREARNVYVWDDADAARSFFTSQMRERVGALYGVQPRVEYSEVCALVENTHA
ncbi:MAG TPA: hypothetical protein VGM84_10025 [Steroidobacteraceae bacterium]|jgi:heme-degrading monooxygenase HmoA